jgi:hypothetical protein
LQLAVEIEQTRKDSIEFILHNLAECDLTLLPRMFPRIAVDLLVHNQKKERKSKGLPEEIPKTNSTESPPPSSPKDKSKKDKKEKKEESKKLETKKSQAVNIFSIVTNSFEDFQRRKEREGKGREEGERRQEREGEGEREGERKRKGKREGKES